VAVDVREEEWAARGAEAVEVAEAVEAPVGEVVAAVAEAEVEVAAERVEAPVAAGVAAKAEAVGPVA